jgi:hypothetical protein
VAAIRKVAREVPGAAEQIAAVCTGHDYSKPGKPAIDWDDPAAKDAQVSALVNDANAVVAALQDRDLEERAASALALLAWSPGRTWSPPRVSDGTGGRWRIARKVAWDRVISTVDPDVRHTVALSRTRVATFGVLCRNCPLRAQCTTCQTGRKLIQHERDDLLRAARAD